MNLLVIGDLALQDSGADTVDSDNTRVAPPRLDKMKSVVKRDRILQQAQEVFSDIEDWGKTKSLLGMCLFIYATNKYPSGSPMSFTLTW